MTDSGRSATTFCSYLGLLSNIVFSSMMALGLIVGLLVLVIGETTINLDGVVEISRIDALWSILGLPILSVLILVLVSPLSYLLYRLLVRRGTDREGTRPSPTDQRA